MGKFGKLFEKCYKVVKENLTDFNRLKSKELRQMLKQSYDSIF